MELSSAPETHFKELFASEYEKLCRYAYTYMQDEHLSEDVVQETFIKIWEQKRNMVSTPEIKYYLVTAVRNNCITVLRKQKSQRTNFTENTPEPEPEPFFTDRQHKETHNEQVKMIREALNQLPPKCKEVFLMVKMHGMSYKQAADALNLSVKTIENQMGKAIKLLKEFAVNRPALVFFILLVKKILVAVGVYTLFGVL